MLEGIFVPAVGIARSARSSAGRGARSRRTRRLGVGRGSGAGLSRRRIGGTGTLVGAGIARELLYVGAPVSAEEAYRISLANKVAPAGEALAAGQGDFLNVVQAAAILLFEVVRQRRR